MALLLWWACRADSISLLALEALTFEVDADITLSSVTFTLALNPDASGGCSTVVQIERERIE
jgi:hypothetical protein